MFRCSLAAAADRTGGADTYGPGYAGIRERSGVVDKAVLRDAGKIYSEHRELVVGA